MKVCVQARFGAIYPALKQFLSYKKVPVEHPCLIRKIKAFFFQLLKRKKLFQ